jgi:hypothetical protein
VPQADPPTGAGLNQTGRTHRTEQLIQVVTMERAQGSACGTLCRSAPSESMSQTGLLDGEGPGPVVAIPQPAWADADVHDVGIMGALRAVRVLG